MKWLSENRTVRAIEFDEEIYVTPEVVAQRRRVLS